MSSFKDWLPALPPKPPLPRWLLAEIEATRKEQKALENAGEHFPGPPTRARGLGVHASPERRKRTPTRDQVRVEVWEERDRLHIGIQEKETGNYILSWWDDEARQMFEQGFFKRGKGLEESVLAYAEEHGILAPPG